MPCSGPRGPLALRSLSRAAAMSIASGFTSRTALMAGPRLSTSSMRLRYFSVRESALNRPELMPACKSEIVASSRSKDFAETS